MSLDPEFAKQLKSMMEDVKAIKDTVTKTEEKIDSFTTELDKLKLENAENKTKIEELSKQNRELSSALNDLEQYSRIDNVIINGIPNTEGENIHEVIIDIAKNLEVNLNEYEINTAHRLYANKDKIPAIIVRLNNRNKKQQLIKNSKRIRLHGKNLNMEPAVPIYVSEHLSPHTLSIYKSAMELKNKGIITYVWIKDSKIFIREDENGQSRRIKDINDLPTPEEVINPENTVDQVSQQTNTVKSNTNPPLTLSQLNLRSYTKRGRSSSKNRSKK